MYFGNNGLPKTWLNQCLKSLFSEYASKSNMANAPKNCSHLKDSPFTTFIHHWEVNCPTKSAEKQHGKCPQTLFTFERQYLYHIY